MFPFKILVKKKVLLNILSHIYLKKEGRKCRLNTAICVETCISSSNRYFLALNFSVHHLITFQINKIKMFLLADACEVVDIDFILDK